MHTLKILGAGVACALHAHLKSASDANCYVITFNFISVKLTCKLKSLSSNFVFLLSIFLNATLYYFHVLYISLLQLVHLTVRGNFEKIRKFANKLKLKKYVYNM